MYYKSNMIIIHNGKVELDNRITSYKIITSEVIISRNNLTIIGLSERT